MITLCCTQKTQRRLRLTAVVTNPSPSSAALGDWYLHLVNFGRTQVVLATSERSLLTVLLPARELRTTLESNLLSAVLRLLLALEIPVDAVNREIEAMQPMAYGKATNRRVLGSMNTFAFYVSVCQYHEQDALPLAMRLAKTPMSAIGYKSHLGFPCDTARDLLCAEMSGASTRN